MVIINKTKNTILAKDTLVAATLITRIKGLLGRNDFQQGEALIIKPCNSIHTFFMHFPIDVLFVDKDSRVIKALSCLIPFRLSKIYFNASLAIELPAGTIQSTLTSEGDTLLL